jgi:hypothetical protein
MIEVIFRFPKFAEKYMMGGIFMSLQSDCVSLGIEKKLMDSKIQRAEERLAREKFDR